MNSEKIKIKVCGMHDPDNISDLVTLQPDFMGFILFPGSPRYLGDTYQLTAKIPDNIQRVGVFVDSEVNNMMHWIEQLSLDYVQLHGNESPESCKEIIKLNVGIIKSFSMEEHFDFYRIEPYLPFCDFFLFDTKTPLYGGSGQKFDKSILANYTFPTPFFLSGGIGPEDISLATSKPRIPYYALDINSRFEKSPAIKDISLLRNFIDTVRSV